MRENDKVREIYDIHTHLLPSVDDGAYDWDTCLQMIEKSWNSGVRQIIATPHYLPWETGQKPGQIKTLCHEAEKKAWEQLGRRIRIFQGQEIYFHMDMVEKLEKGEILTLAGSRYVLVEFAPDAAFSLIYRGVKQIRRGQYYPVLAHAERYGCLRQEERLADIVRAGALLQVNVGAFCGVFPDKIRQWSRKQLLNRRIDFVASDMHNLKSRPPILRTQLGWLEKRLDEEYKRELLNLNANRINHTKG